MKHKGLFELELPPPPPPTEIDRIIEQRAQDAADKWHRHVEQVTGTPFVAPCDLWVERVGLTDDGEAQVVFRATATMGTTNERDNMETEVTISELRACVSELGGIAGRAGDDVMKIKQRHRDRVATYLRWWRQCGGGIYEPGMALAKARRRAVLEDKAFQPALGIRTASALQAFTRHESTGDLWASDDDRKLDRIMCGKAVLNLWIKSWAEGVAEGVTFLWELQEDVKLSWLPEWVWTAIKEQSRRCKPLVGMRWGAVDAYLQWWRELSAM